MEALQKAPNCTGDPFVVEPSARDISIQVTLSLILGLSAFIAFCTLRPRWPSLYAARKRRLNPTIALPALPDSFLGWVPKLYGVTEQQVLESAGLDAFVLLRFFKMAIMLISIMCFFAATVLWPIHNHFKQSVKEGGGHTSMTPVLTQARAAASGRRQTYIGQQLTWSYEDDDTTFNPDKGYLWAYFVFTYFFTALIIYVVNLQTFQVIRIRQDYLGGQSTLTDRTLRLSGLPTDLRSEEKIKQLLESLEIGKVDNVTLCRNWAHLDKLVGKRDVVLRQLESAWSEYLRRQGSCAPSSAEECGQNGDLLDPENGVEVEDEQEEETRRLLLGYDEQVQGKSQFRPQFRVWYGFLGLQSRQTDAIEHLEEELRRLDDEILEAREAQYEPSTMAFVTMDSSAACQMAIQTCIDPRPNVLLRKPAPAPPDIVWRNTYSPRGVRRLKSWTVVGFVTVLTLVWLIPLSALASLLSFCTISKALPQVAEWLGERPVAKSLVQTGLPTLAVSLLNVAVPYLYDYLSNRQGFISRSDVELAAISKNFFFTFFNIFVVFTVSGTAATFWASLRQVIKNTELIPQAIANSITTLGSFYANFILLQGVGLMPFRLLEVGSVALYPIMRMLARTRRDMAELSKPPTFQFGFHLPTALFIFILCTVYSVLRWGLLILTCGLVYFVLGYFTYKYQLLYAMDQPRHATGGAWRIICRRIVLGLLVFQVAMSGVLALESAIVGAALIVPLIILTGWYGFYFGQRFEPLTRFIALRSIRSAGACAGVRDSDSDIDAALQAEERRGTVDEDREKGLQFVNPSMVMPLQPPWIYDDPPPPASQDSGLSARRPISVPMGDNALLGDAHVWEE